MTGFDERKDGLAVPSARLLMYVMRLLSGDQAGSVLVPSKELKDLSA